MHFYKLAMRAQLPTPKGQHGLSDVRGMQGIWAGCSVCICTMKTPHNFSCQPGSYETVYEVIWVA